MRKNSAIFSECVLKVVSAIPRGSTLTYKEVATRAGSPRACRAVGNIISKNYNPRIPCHRVIYSNGNLGGYNRGSAMKLLLLKQEGVMLTITRKNKIH